MKQEFYDALQRQRDIEGRLKQEEGEKHKKNRQYSLEVQSQIKEKEKLKLKEREEFFKEGYRREKERQEKDKRIEVIKDRKLQVRFRITHCRHILIRCRSSTKWACRPSMSVKSNARWLTTAPIAEPCIPANKSDSNLTALLLPFSSFGRNHSDFGLEQVLQLDCIFGKLADAFRELLGGHRILIHVPTERLFIKSHFGDILRGRYSVR